MATQVMKELQLVFNAQLDITVNLEYKQAVQVVIIAHKDHQHTKHALMATFVTMKVKREGKYVLLGLIAQMELRQKLHQDIIQFNLHLHTLQTLAEMVICVMEVLLDPMMNHAKLELMQNLELHHVLLVQLESTVR